MRKMSLIEFGKRYPHIHDSIVGVGKSTVGNFFISPHMYVERLGPIFWLYYHSIYSKKDFYLVSYYANSRKKDGGDLYD